MQRGEMSFCVESEPEKISHCHAKPRRPRDVFSTNICSLLEEMCLLMLLVSSECNKNLEDGPKLAHALTLSFFLKWIEHFVFKR